MTRVDRVDLASGILVLATGAFFAFGALEYRIGSAARMGPGFVPLVLGIIAMVLGVAIIISALGREGRLPDFRLRTIAPILAGILAFALILPRVGVVPATFATVILCALSSPQSKVWTSLALAVGVCILIWLTFVVLLGLPIPVIRSPF